MEDLQRLLQGQLGGAAAMGDMPLNDTAETIQISSLALLKMLKHGIVEKAAKLKNRQGWRPYGSHGTYAWRIC